MVVGSFFALGPHSHVSELRSCRSTQAIQITLKLCSMLYNPFPQSTGVDLSSMMSTKYYGKVTQGEMRRPKGK